MPTDTLPTIDLEALSRVSGGTSSNDQITAALSAITNSLSQLSASRNQSDPTMMMMMMMMMAAAVAPRNGFQNTGRRGMPGISATGGPTLQNNQAFSEIT
jgi:hypothetical protein